MVPYELLRNENIRERKEKFKEIRDRKATNDNRQAVSIGDTLTKCYQGSVANGTSYHLTGYKTPDSNHVTPAQSVANCPDEVLNSAPESRQELNLEPPESLGICEVEGEK